MMPLYARVFVQILDSSLAENWKARHVFEDLLKLADIGDGVVDMTREVISRRTNIPIEEVRAAIEYLEAPDPNSRDAAEEGRRIVRLDDHRDWGWRIVNWAKYDGIRSVHDRRAQTAERMRRMRERKGNPLPPAPPSPGSDQSREREEGASPQRHMASHGVTPAAKSLSPSPDGPGGIGDCPPGFVGGDPNRYEPVAQPAVEAPIGDAISKVAAAHAAWQRLTGQKMRLDPYAERLWLAWLQAGHTEQELQSVVMMIQRGIKDRNRNAGALKLRNLLSPDRFAEDLAMVGVASPAATPSGLGRQQGDAQPRAKSIPPPPTGFPKANTPKS